MLTKEAITIGKTFGLVKKESIRRRRREEIDPPSAMTYPYAFKREKSPVSEEEGKKLRRRGPRLRQSGVRAVCRFCSLALPRPKERKDALHPNLPGGACKCGAVFVVDPTGRNGGVALIESLADASGDIAKAGFMVPGRDYEDYIENYEPLAHRFLLGFKGYRRGMARFYLVKLIQKDE